MTQNVAPAHSEIPTSGRLRREKRRHQVFELCVLRKFRTGEAAEVLEISKRTAERDLQAVQDRLRSALREARHTEKGLLTAALEAVSECDNVIRLALSDHASIRPGEPQRSRLLNTVLGAIEQRVKILQAVGVLDLAVGDDLGAPGLIVGDQLILGRLENAELGALRQALHLMRRLGRAGPSAKGLLAEFSERLDALGAADQERSESQTQEVTDVSSE